MSKQTASTDYIVTQEEMLMLTETYGLRWRTAAAFSEFDQPTKEYLFRLMTIAYEKGRTGKSELARPFVDK